MSDVTGGKVVEADVRSFEGRQVASVVSGSSHEREKEGGGGWQTVINYCCRGPLLSSWAVAEELAVL